MMIGELPRTHPTVQIPPVWDPYEDPTAEINSPFPVNGSSPSSGPFGSPDYSNPFSVPDSFGSRQGYVLSNEPEPDMFDDDFSDLPLDAFSGDNFRMYDFKVRRCARGRSHDWTECPFAHPGEKARRRDPRRYGYSGTACPEFRKGSCRRGDTCEFAHGVFECWLHPDRYRTQACKDGQGCRRRICFFAHSPEQLRVMSLQSPRKGLVSSNSADSYDGSPLRRSSFDSYIGGICNNNKASSFGSSSPPTSPPSSPPPLSSSYNSVHELVSNMRNLQLAKAKLSTGSVWGGMSSMGSPRGSSNLRPGFLSLPTTPTRIPARSGLAQFEQWDSNNNSIRACEEEPVMERVESGRDLRAKIYAKLSKENSFGPVNGSQLTDPDVGWISDLVE
uniref:C3H1-type domain-containing protein n=1 Tax=Kalanchoe fedtschenkoi TaxID=63787 RepID=A0A7N0ZRX5_KALFE